MRSVNAITKLKPTTESGLGEGTYINFQKLISTLEKTSNYKLKDGKFYSRINGEWKELKDCYNIKKGC